MAGRGGDEEPMAAAAVGQVGVPQRVVISRLIEIVYVGGADFALCERMAKLQRLLDADRRANADVPVPCMHVTTMASDPASRPASSGCELAPQRLWCAPTRMARRPCRRPARKRVECANRFKHLTGDGLSDADVSCDAQPGESDADGLTDELGVAHAVKSGAKFGGKDSTGKLGFAPAVKPSAKFDVTGATGKPEAAPAVKANAKVDATGATGKLEAAPAVKSNARFDVTGATGKPEAAPAVKANAKVDATGATGRLEAAPAVKSNAKFDDTGSTDKLEVTPAVKLGAVFGGRGPTAEHANVHTVALDMDLVKLVFDVQAHGRTVLQRRFLQFAMQPLGIEPSAEELRFMEVNGDDEVQLQEFVELVTGRIRAPKGATHCGS